MYLLRDFEKAEIKGETTVNVENKSHAKLPESMTEGKY